MAPFGPPTPWSQVDEGPRSVLGTPTGAPKCRGFLLAKRAARSSPPRADRVRARLLPSELQGSPPSLTMTKEPGSDIDACAIRPERFRQTAGSKENGESNHTCMFAARKLGLKTELKPLSRQAQPCKESMRHLCCLREPSKGNNKTQGRRQPWLCTLAAPWHQASSTLRLPPKHGMHQQLSQLHLLAVFT